MKKLIYLLIVFGIFLGGCSPKGGEEQMIPQRSYYYVVTEDNTAEELQNMFWEHEEAFDYIVEVIKILDGLHFTIVIGDEKKGNVLFFDTIAEVSDGRGGYSVELTDGSDFGYVKDELFEQYVNDLLVGEKLVRIDFTKGFPSISFGNNWQIYYEEGQPTIPKINSERSGTLKENWSYHVPWYE